MNTGPIIVWTILAIAVPWWLGAVLVARLTNARWTSLTAIGSGWLLGQALVAVGLFATSGPDGALRPRIVLGLMVVALMAVLLLGRGKQVWSSATNAAPVSAGWRLLLALIGASLILKLVVMGAALAGPPILGDDAISLWLFKTKVIATLGKLPLDPAGPNYLGGSNPHYPPTLALMAAWVPLVCGAWSEALAAIFWPTCWVSLVLMLAGGLRAWVGTVGAWMAAYVVGGVPLAWVHVIRPGYADLPLATFVAAAVLFLWAWHRAGDVRLLLLGFVFAAVAACLKREGPILAAVVVVAGVAPYLGRVRDWTRAGRAIVGASFLVIAASAAMVVDFSEQRETLRALGWHPEAATRLARHAFEWSSFELLGAAMVVLAAAALWRARGSARVALGLLVLGAVGFVVGVFLLTPQARFALNDQTPSRLMLQIAPALAVALAATWPIEKRAASL